MANPEHLEILKQGVEVWNRWKEESHEINEFDLRGAELFDRDLSGIDLRFTNLHGADLSNTNLTDARLGSSILHRVKFIQSGLVGTNLILADLSGADFYRAILSNANFNRANLRGADFTEAEMALTSFADNDLSGVKGLEAIRHLAPSFISIDSIYKSQGNIPEVFLRACGIPESFITQIPALIASVEPIQFYKCFISFTEADDAFSERLYNDLQSKGVRCWRWKEDAKWGKTLMRSIDEAVRLYDKLIVICSEQSLNSPAVIREIERALQKEDDLARQGKDAEVLFPIRLDDYIFTGWQHHRKADVTAKNVGDFREWKDHDQYQKAFDRLLRDLKAE